MGGASAISSSVALLPARDVNELVALAKASRGWYAILMPGQTPSSIIRRFAASLHRVLQAGDVKQRLASQGIDTATSTPEQMRKVIAADLVQWAKVVRDAGVQPE
jgi:tripartite-type tricarboxylate transporter receptor subunit TctC